MTCRGRDPKSRGSGNNRFPKRDRLTTSPISSPRVTPRPCFFTGLQNTKKWAAISRDAPGYLHRSFWSSRCTDQPRTKLSLDVNDDLGPAQVLNQPLVVPTQFLQLLCLRIALGLGATLVRGQALKNASLALATPGDQVRGVEAFTREQGSDCAGLSGGIDRSRGAACIRWGSFGVWRRRQPPGLLAVRQTARMRRHCPSLHYSHPRSVRPPYAPRRAMPQPEPKRFHCSSH